MNGCLFCPHCLLDELVEGDGGAEDFQHLVEQVIGEENLVGHLVVYGVVFVFQQVGVWPLF